MRKKLRYVLYVVILIVILLGIFAFTNVKENVDSVEQDKIPLEIMENSEIIRRGSFVDIDSVHKGEGDAVIFKTENGGILNFQNFKVTNGPDLFVYLSKNDDIKENGDLGEFISLGKLKSSSGEQSYNLPEDYEEYNSVVIWCRAFSVLFSVAEFN